MRAITVVPGVAGSARLDEVPEPDTAQGSLLVKALALGVCGTDREIVAGKLGAPPPDRQRLILGHESLGIVEEAPKDGGFERGDHVVAIVRLPDPVPCPACAAGEWDMCRNGQYVEHGIKERDGFGSERFRTDPRFTVKVGAGLGPLAILLEPTSIVAKAWDQIERIGRRSPSWRPHRVLVTGAGSIGLLAALIDKQRGLEVHLFDRSPEGPKPKLTRGLGATYHIDDVAAVVADLKPDIIVECTGAAAIAAEVVGRAAAAGIVCLAGLSGNKTLNFDIGLINHTMVLENQVAFGTVNANRRHYEAAAEMLARADHSWLAGLISRRVPLDRWMEALDDRPDDIKVVIDFTL